MAKAKRVVSQTTPQKEQNDPQSCSPAAAPAVSSVKKIMQIGKIAAAKLVVGPDGRKYFNVDFMKKNTSKKPGAPEFITRNMTCRLGVKKYTKAKLAGIVNSVDSTTDEGLALLGKVHVWQATGKKGYKTLTLDRITHLKIGGSEYAVK